MDYLLQLVANWSKVAGHGIIYVSNGVSPQIIENLAQTKNYGVVLRKSDETFVKRVPGEDKIRHFEGNTNSDVLGMEPAYLFFCVTHGKLCHNLFLAQQRIRN